MKYSNDIYENLYMLVTLKADSCHEANSFVLMTTTCSGKACRIIQCNICKKIKLLFWWSWNPRWHFKIYTHDTTHLEKVVRRKKNRSVWQEPYTWNNHYVDILGLFIAIRRPRIAILRSGSWANSRLQGRRWDGQEADPVRNSALKKRVSGTVLLIVRIAFWD